MKNLINILTVGVEDSKPIFEVGSDYVDIPYEYIKKALDSRFHFSYVYDDDVHEKIAKQYETKNGLCYFYSEWDYSEDNIPYTIALLTSTLELILLQEAELNEKFNSKWYTAAYETIWVSDKYYATRKKYLKDQKNVELKYIRCFSNLPSYLAHRANERWFYAQKRMNSALENVYIGKTITKHHYSQMQSDVSYELSSVFDIIADIPYIPDSNVKQNKLIERCQFEIVAMYGNERCKFEDANNIRFRFLAPDDMDKFSWRIVKKLCKLYMPKYVEIAASAVPVSSNKEYTKFDKWLYEKDLYIIRELTLDIAKTMKTNDTQYNNTEGKR